MINDIKDTNVFKQHLKYKGYKTKMIKCDSCNQMHKRKNVVVVKGEFLCANCRKKLKGEKMPFVPFSPPMEKLLNKIYEVRPSHCEGPSISGHAYFNRLLIGKKFKIKIVEE